MITELENRWEWVCAKVKKRIQTSLQLTYTMIISYARSRQKLFELSLFTIANIWNGRPTMFGDLD